MKSTCWNRLKWLACATLVLLAMGVGEARAAFFNDLLATNLGGGSFSAFDPTSGAPLGTFGTGVLQFPRGIAINPADNNIYVADIGNQTVQKFSGVTGASLGTFVNSGSGGLSYPFGMTFGPNGDLFIASANSSSVMEYNGTTGAFVKIFASGANIGTPTGIAFGPNGDLYVAGSGPSQIVEFNGTTGSFVKILTTGIVNPAGIAFGNGALYATNGSVGSQTLYKIDPTTGAILATVNDSHLNTPAGVVVDSLGRVLVASNGNNAIVRFNPDLSYNSILASGGSLNGPIQLALLPNAVPEPASVLLMGLGVAGIAGVSLRRARRITA